MHRTGNKDDREGIGLETGTSIPVPKFYPLLTKSACI